MTKIPQKNPLIYSNSVSHLKDLVIRPRVSKEMVILFGSFPFYTRSFYFITRQKGDFETALSDYY